MVPTTRSAEASVILTPIRVPRWPAENRAWRSTPSAVYSSTMSCGKVTLCCSPMGRLRSVVVAGPGAWPAAGVVPPASLSERSVGRRLFQADDDGLAGGGVAGVGRGVQRDQHVGLRVVRRRAAPGGRVVHD